MYNKKFAFPIFISISFASLFILGILFIAFGLFTSVQNLLYYGTIILVIPFYGEVLFEFFKIKPKNSELAPVSWLKIHNLLINLELFGFIILLLFLTIPPNLHSYTSISIELFKEEYATMYYTIAIFVIAFIYIRYVRSLDFFFGDDFRDNKDSSILGGSAFAALAMLVFDSNVNDGMHYLKKGISLYDEALKNEGHHFIPLERIQRLFDLKPLLNSNSLSQCRNLAYCLSEQKIEPLLTKINEILAENQVVIDSLSPGKSTSYIDIISKNPLFTAIFAAILATILDTYEFKTINNPIISLGFFLGIIIVFFNSIVKDGKTWWSSRVDNEHLSLFEN